MECYYCLRNVHDLLSDGKTPYERRLGETFQGPVIPFGSMIELSSYFCQNPVKNPPAWQKKVLFGRFLGDALYAGRIWKGDIFGRRH